MIVPGCPDVRADPSPEFVGALRCAHSNGARLVSICSGAFTLAAAGLLDGREAATHWLHASLLQERFPRVRVNADVLYVDGGDVLTSAGTAAGIDLCLHLIRRDHGAGALWTLISPTAAFLYAATWMLVALAGLAATRAR